MTYCRVAPSLGELDNHHSNVWGTKDYDPKKHRDEPTVFFGLYDLRDYYALWKHRGKAWVLWAGSDLENLIHGFMFNDGKLKLLSRLIPGNKRLIKKVLARAEHYVEDKDEHDKIASFGLESRIVPSFLGNISEFPCTYTHSKEPHVYISGHPDREEEYGFDFVEELAERLPYITFHLYGADWESKSDNIVCHGNVPKKQFNEEIKYYHCGLRLNMSDGFSEITAKSVLMGQYPITYLEYPMIPNFQNISELVSLLHSLKTMSKPNHKAREYYMKVLNKYPWNKNV